MLKFRFMKKVPPSLILIDPQERGRAVDIHISQFENVVFRLFYIFLVVFSFAVSTSPASAQSPVTWQLTTDDTVKSLATGQRLEVKLKAKIEGGWHLYALDQPAGGPAATTIKPTEGSLFQLDNDIRSGKALSKPDQNFKVDDKPLETKFFLEAAEFVVTLKTVDRTTPDSVSLDVRFQTCNEESCLPPKTVRVSFGGTEVLKKTSSPAVTSSPGKVTAPVANESSNSPANQPGDLWSFIWLAVSVGALSLLTPCVFPMIPITVSYFTNHPSHTRGKAIRLAAVYSLGIIATFTLLGMLLAVFVGAAGITLFAANPWVNLLVTCIFLFFAFNLFGAYELTIPSGVLTKLDNLTRSKEGEGSGIVGALLMGLTFTLTSFTCTSPFVGTILVSASQGNWQRPLVGMLVFSTIFALPFFILALAPQLASQLPRAGGWMNSVKVTMGFLEVAAAMKFISNVDLIWKWHIFTRSVVLAIWISIGVILAAYLLGKFQLFHDTRPEKISALRLVSAIMSLAISFYLVTGLFGAKLGELESFLPPDVDGLSAAPGKSGRSPLNWREYENNFDGAMTRAKADKKLVFVDFTGYTCTNCRWMEANIFTRREVEDQLGKFVLARLYTDGEDAIDEQQQQFEQNTFNTVALPFYAVFNTDGRAVATFPGLTRNAAEFVDFLQKAQKN
jgi:thiol:disulfide interchange protein